MYCGAPMSEERLVAEIPSELKRLVDADSRTNKQVVIAALWAEMGGERTAEVERRIDEKERRISTVESEKNERVRELDKLKNQKKALEKKLTKEEQEAAETWEEALALLHIERGVGGVTIKAPDSACEDFAKDLGMKLKPFKDELKTRWANE